MEAEHCSSFCGSTWGNFGVALFEVWLSNKSELASETTMNRIEQSAVTRFLVESYHLAIIENLFSGKRGDDT